MYRVNYQVSNYILLGVPPCCLHAMAILPDLQLSKENKADIGTAKSVNKM